MIGNDVVDLQSARSESNWRRPGYLEKIFSIAERRQIEQAPDREQYVWMLWTMKESAYKIYNRKSGKRIFNPRFFNCCVESNFDDRFSGIVNFGNQTVFTCTESAGSQLHTVATLNREWIDLITDLPHGNEYYKQDGIPYFISKGNKVPISVSHHGQFCRKVYLSPSRDFSFKNISAIS